MTAQKTQAIQTALTGNWEEAININEAILQEEPDDIDTLNRLAFAYSSLGEIQKAKATYQRVLGLDAHNPIALRNIKRLTGAAPVKNGTITSITPLSLTNLFIEEPGKTKVIELINTADKKTLINIRSGEQMEMQVKRMKIFIVDKQKHYIGMLPDDLSKRLIKFIEVGNQYAAYIKNATEAKVFVFVKEVRRVNKLKNQPSFLSGEKSKLNFKSIPEHANYEPEDDREEESL